MEKILVTGGAGFIGSNFIRQFMKNNPQTKIVNLDKLTYAGRLESLADIEKNPDYEFIKGDICDSAIVEKAMQGCNAAINFAAESHVDRSIKDADAFAKTNFLGVKVLCEQARRQGIEKFLQISTDEVYGQIKSGSFSETSRLNPRNPYSAAKAGGELLAMSYFTTFGLPVVVTRSSNNYGQFQFPEKVMPLFITNLLEGKKVPLYGEGKQIRDWLFVLDNCEAIELCLKKGKAGEVYNIGGNRTLTIGEALDILLSYSKKKFQIRVDPALIRPSDVTLQIPCIDKFRNQTGWEPEIPLEQTLKEA